jgi:hypothetical protein
MSEDNWYQNYDDAGRPADPHAPVSKRGMSTGMKVLIGVLIAGGVMLLLCCGGLFFVGSRFRSMMTDDPVKVQEIREQIAGIDLPEEWEPVGGFDGGFFGFQIDSVIYKKGDAVFTLMQINVPGEISAEELREQVTQSMQQQGQNSEIDVESKEERTLTIAGEETTLEFVKGTTQDGQEVRQVKGTFSGRGGPALLFYQVPEADWDDEQVVNLLESIQK